MKPWITFALILFVGVGSADESSDEQVRGRLCYLSGQEIHDVSRCDVVEGERITVEPAEEPRRFAWSSEDGKMLIVDVLDAGGTVIDLAATRGVIRLAVSGSRERGWPLPLRALFQSRQNAWKLLLPSSASRLREVRVPHGQYAMGLRCDHHDRVIRTGLEVGEKETDLGTIPLEPLPVFTAAVVRKDGTPLGGAVLIDDTGATVANADHLGRMSLEAPCDETIRLCALPGEVTIEYPGLAGSRVLIPDTRADFDAGAVVLGSGGSLEIAIQREGEETYPVSVEIADEPRRREGPETKGRTLRETSIAEDQDEIRIDDLPAGKTSLYLRGDGTGEVVSRYVTVEEGGVTREEFEITPVTFNVRVFEGETPAPGADVSIGVPHGWPDHDVELPPTDDEGRTSIAVWRTDAMVVVAARDETREIVFLGRDHSPDITIRLSSTVIRGRIYEEGTGDPLRGVEAQYGWSGEGGRSYRSIKADDEGRFEIAGAKPGHHRIMLELPGYPPAEATLDTTAADVERTLDIPVSRGLEHELLIQWEDGTPIPQAHIVEVIESGRRYGRWTTDATGTATIPIGKGSVKELWVVPAEGSFGFTTISAGDRNSVARIPRPTGAIVLRTVDDDEAPAPSSHLGVRFRGRTIDYFVADIIALAQGIRFRTGSDGTTSLRGFPPGEYEIWAVQYDGDDLGVGEPHEQDVASFYYAGGAMTVTVEARRVDLVRK